MKFTNNVSRAPSREWQQQLIVSSAKRACNTKRVPLSSWSCVIVFTDFVCTVVCSQPVEWRVIIEQANAEEGTLRIAHCLSTSPLRYQERWRRDLSLARSTLPAINTKYRLIIPVLQSLNDTCHDSRDVICTIIILVLFLDTTVIIVARRSR